MALSRKSEKRWCGLDGNRKGRKKSNTTAKKELAKRTKRTCFLSFASSHQNGKKGRAVKKAKEINGRQAGKMRGLMEDCGWVFFECNGMANGTEGCGMELTSKRSFLLSNKKRNKKARWYERPASK